MMARKISLLALAFALTCSVCKQLPKRNLSFFSWEMEGMSTVNAASILPQHTAVRYHDGRIRLGLRNKLASAGGK